MGEDEGKFVPPLRENNKDTSELSPDEKRIVNHVLALRNEITQENFDICDDPSTRRLYNRGTVTILNMGERGKKYLAEQSLNSNDGENAFAVLSGMSDQKDLPFILDLLDRAVEGRKDIVVRAFQFVAVAIQERQRANLDLTDISPHIANIVQKAGDFYLDTEAMMIEYLLKKDKGKYSADELWEIGTLLADAKLRSEEQKRELYLMERPPKEELETVYMPEDLYIKGIPETTISEDEAVTKLRQEFDGTAMDISKGERMITSQSESQEALGILLENAPLIKKLLLSGHGKEADQQWISNILGGYIYRGEVGREYYGEIADSMKYLLIASLSELGAKELSPTQADIFSDTIEFLNRFGGNPFQKRKALDLYLDHEMVEYNGSGEYEQIQLAKAIFLYGNKSQQSKFRAQFRRLIHDEGKKHSLEDLTRALIREKDGSLQYEKLDGLHILAIESALQGMLGIDGEELVALWKHNTQQNRQATNPFGDLTYDSVGFLPILSKNYRIITDLVQDKGVEVCKRLLERTPNIGRYPINILLRQDELLQSPEKSKRSVAYALYGKGDYNGASYQDEVLLTNYQKELEKFDTDLIIIETTKGEINKNLVDLYKRFGQLSALPDIINGHGDETGISFDGEHLSVNELVHPAKLKVGHNARRNFAVVRRIHAGKPTFILNFCRAGVNMSPAFQQAFDANAVLAVPFDTHLKDIKLYPMTDDLHQVKVVASFIDFSEKNKTLERDATIAI